MSNDFKSLLNNFRQATNSSVHSVPADKSSSSSIQDAIAQFWRISRLRRATTMQQRTEDGTAADDRTTIHFHLAICVCIIDSLVHEPIWREFIHNNGTKQTHPSMMTTSAEMYIHAKYPEKIVSPWVRGKTISTTYRPNWNDVRIIQAMLALASEAFKDDRTTHVIFVTESCIPIATLPDVARVVLTSPTSSNPMNQSFIHAYHRDSSQCTRFDEVHCFGILSKFFPPETLYKALPGWCLFSRFHMQRILNLPSLLGIPSTEKQNVWSLFENVWAPEELYFATCLSLLGHLPSEDVMSQSLLFACWDVKAKNHSDRAHPRIYDREFSRNLVQDLRASGYLFMRKLQQPIKTSFWKSAIESSESRDVDSWTVDGSSRKRIRPV